MTWGVQGNILGLYSNDAWLKVFDDADDTTLIGTSIALTRVAGSDTLYRATGLSIVTWPADTYLVRVYRDNGAGAPDDDACAGVFHLDVVDGQTSEWYDAVLDSILDRDLSEIVSALAALQVKVDASGMPAELIQGADYVDSLDSAIRLDLTVNGSPFTGFGAVLAADLDWTFAIGRGALKFNAAATWVADGDGYVQVELTGSNLSTLTKGVQRWQLFASDGADTRPVVHGTVPLIDNVAGL